MRSSYKSQDGQWWPGRKRDCTRNGCTELATHLVAFDAYIGGGYRACYSHARWWVKDLLGRRIGTVTAL